MVPIIISIILFFVSYFTVTFIDPSLSAVSAVFIIIFAAPSFYYLIKESQNGVRIILILSALAIIIESIGILTGFPYSRFEYTELIGGKILGLAPWTLPFAFVPLVIGAMYFALKQKSLTKIFLVATGLLVLTDLILDPAAVALKIWVWEINGLFYGVPFVNFLGWIFTSMLCVVVFLLNHQNPLTKNTALSFYFIVSFWTGACFWLNLWIPFLIGIFLWGLITLEFLKK